MTDVKLVQDDFGVFDISVADGQIEIEDGFETAIWISLFTDARAPESLVPLPQWRRGWPGNIVSPVEGRDLGGLLWLIDQRRLTQRTLNEAIDYSRKSLLWFLEDGLVRDILVNGQIIAGNGIQISVTLQTKQGKTETYYIKTWEVTDGN